jgi:sugar phosphate isomerase/epimerase
MSAAAGASNLFRLGIGSYTYPWAVGMPGRRPSRPLGPEGLVRRAQALGVHVVQICDNICLQALPEVELAALRELAAGLGVELEVGLRTVDPGELMAYLSIARALGSRLVRTVPELHGRAGSAQEVEALLLQVLPAFADAGIVLALENHGKHMAKELVAIMEALASPWAGICLDTANSIGVLEPPGVVVDALAPWAVSLHLKDFRVRRLEHGLGFVVEGCPLGTGALDVPGVLECVARAQRPLSAIIELWPPPADTLEETIAREERWAAESVRFVQRLLMG